MLHIWIHLRYYLLIPVFFYSSQVFFNHMTIVLFSAVARNLGSLPNSEHDIRKVTKLAFSFFILRW